MPSGWEVVGPADGPPIVFVHGAVMTRAQWRLQVDHFAAAGYRCVLVDLPGHGTLADRPFTLEAAAGHVIDVIDTAAGGRAVLVGLSLGGYVSMTVAGQSPERVRGLVLAGSTREPSGPTRAAFWLIGWGLGVAPESVLRGYVGWLYRRRYGQGVSDAILANGYYAKGGGAAIRTLSGARFRERLAAYGGPIHVINGNLDLVFRLGERQFLEGLPGVTSQRIGRAAHLSNVDRPDEFSGAVQGFLETLAP
ncbi:MAG TPA: alpha/beta hydrolase [Candidatus Limnocylindrales bacterium]|nr:alpha/beta hydrolase [Candidatus Limnocylindrales bacterium]